MNEISYANEGGFDVSATSKAANEAQSSPTQGPDAAQSSTIPVCPVALPVIFENIPAHLRALNSWVVWRFEWSSERGKWSKPPLQASGHYAKVNVPSTWSGFEAVVAAYKSGGFDGIGVILSEEDDVVGVDLDKQTGKFGSLSELAVEALESFDTYGERSPSGNGVRLFCTGTMAARGHNNRKGVEIYRDAHFLTVTGHRIEGAPKTVEPAQDAIDNFIARHFPNSASPPSPSQTQEGAAPDIEAPRLRLRPDEIVPRARAAKNGHKFRALYDFGDISDYGGDDSAADMALCRLLAFWCGRRPDVVDQLFRGSALYKADGRPARWDGPCSEGFTYGQYTIKRVLESCTGFFGDQKPMSVSEADVPVTCGFKADDIGNSQRFAAQHQSRARYCPQWKCWLIYDQEEGRWVRDECFVVEALAKLTARSIDREAEGIEDEAKRDAMRKFAKLSANRHKREKMIEDARSEDDMIIQPTQLDRDLYLLNVLNGSIDLRTGKLRPHAPNDLVSRVAPVEFDPDAKCPVFDKFLSAVFGGDKDVIECVQRALGSALSGDVEDQTVFLLFGSGSNGKSTLLQTIARILGSYAHETPPATFMERKSEGIATDIADLLGVRFALTSESARGQKFDEAKMKRGSGGERITGERKFEHPFSFYPQYKLFFVTNHLPKIEGTEDAVWRRLLTIHFKARFWNPAKRESGPEHLRIDKAMPQKLKAEYPGILNWLVEGCLKWQRKEDGGLLWPQSVLQDLEEYRDDMDPLRLFIAECCQLSPRAQTRSCDLYTAYQYWCLDNDLEEMSESLFGAKLTERGFKRGQGKGRARGSRTRLGIALKEEDEYPNKVTAPSLLSDPLLDLLNSDSLNRGGLL